jgi:hypothetical protein
MAEDPLCWKNCVYSSKYFYVPVIYFSLVMKESLYRNRGKVRMVFHFKYLENLSIKAGKNCTALHYILRLSHILDQKEKKRKSIKKYNISDALSPKE